MVPPMVRIPERLFLSRGMVRFSISPLNPSRNPITVMPYSLMAALPMARMAALRPGVSPPLVSMPMYLLMDLVVFT